MKMEEQVPLRSLNQAKAKPITDKSRKVPAQSNFWTGIVDGRQRIIPTPIDPDPDYHRAITQLLEEGSYEFHTFKLPVEKTLRVMLSGIP